MIKIVFVDKGPRTSGYYNSAMGAQKGKNTDKASHREPMTPIMIQKFVTAVADHSKGKRLKVLAGRVSKIDILSAKEPLTQFNLLQMAVVMNNIPAGKISSPTFHQLPCQTQ